MRLARLRRPPAAFLIIGAITRPATGSITFRQPYPNYMQSFIKIRGAVLQKNGNKTLTLCNFNKDTDKKDVITFSDVTADQKYFVKTGYTSVEN